MSVYPVPPHFSSRQRLALSVIRFGLAACATALHVVTGERWSYEKGDTVVGKDGCRCKVCKLYGGRVIPSAKRHPANPPQRKARK